MDEMIEVQNEVETTPLEETPVVVKKEKKAKRAFVMLRDGLKIPVLTTAEYTKIAKAQFDAEGKGTMSLLVTFGKFQVNARSFFRYSSLRKTWENEYTSGQGIRNEYVLMRVFALLRDEHKVPVKISFVSGRRSHVKANTAQRVKDAKKRAKTPRKQTSPVSDLIDDALESSIQIME